MRHRFFTPLPLDGVIDLAGEERHHAARVVRLHAGEEVELFDGTGSAAIAVVEEVSRDRVRVRVTGRAPAREPAAAFTLAMAVIQLDRFEFVLQKATELGAASIVPLVTDRVEVRPERYRGKRERWERIVFEAVKQSGRAKIPLLEEPATFDRIVAGGEPKILFDADQEPSPAPASLGRCTLLVGPEGGWSGREVDLARAAGCAFARLGPRRLRAETAAVAALATIAAKYGDLV
ncbi:MAG TPA: 16S rRNA (uracil(1498)-N(3))-methyltransferase [Thermoanaerobaculia bacterium]|nr:16S rRNA (uracil(1498)-N(3))-methyltransferase [Thermoanaerobaculia bacterium]